ncbi:inositol polyphosphate 1-phosphatase isoform X2 [Microcaecilia unicolor]|uniref:Inositol polyphosphate 1-phosphatase isoform X2 n=1 Tax=Microcaecilia unicolor TaxID=1415580 RepID=A0A6P7YM02_9AMPH|nr:inositol polyphosphate 1-phosphatase isoform X2 [Microcaecilia unicolor]
MGGVWKRFPGLEHNISGEESNHFTNELGDVITVKVCPTEEETAALLNQVLNGKMVAAEVLARVVHQDIPITDPVLDAVKLEVPQSTLGIWVDPIDATYQYIKGCGDSAPIHGIYSHGLQCVTILIGVYDLSTGVPVMGVINQPFALQDPKSSRWEGQYYWGISYMGTKIFSTQLTTSDDHDEDDSICHIHRHPDSGEIEYECHHFSVVTSTRETERIKTILSDMCGERLHFAAGAGYKSLCVVLGLVDIYSISGDYTFRWDSCAAHAILLSLGGGIVNWEECLKHMKNGETMLDLPHLVYNVDEAGADGLYKWSNKGGLIAFKSKEHLENFLSLLIEKLGL